MSCMETKIKIKKGDIVKVIAGVSKGKEGRVLEVIREKNRAIVEGVNLVSKHKKADAKNPNGGIIKKEASIHVSNLMLLVGGKVSRIGRQLDEKTGKLVRIAKKTGEVIK